MIVADLIKRELLGGYRQEGMQRRQGDGISFKGGKYSVEWWIEWTWVDRAAQLLSGQILARSLPRN